jgi:hypothetical protein
MEVDYDGIVGEDAASSELGLSELDQPVILGTKGFLALFKSVVTLAEELSS